MYFLKQANKSQRNGFGDAAIFQAFAIAFGLHFLAPDHTELGGKRRGGWNHRTTLLSLGVVLNMMMAVLTWAIPKRDVFILCPLTCAETVGLSSNLMQFGSVRFYLLESNY